MDNTQITAPDGSWFVFADWQGVTRIALPGDKVKTDASLDRPNQTKPLVLKPTGSVWLDWSADLDPVAMKKVKPEAPIHNSPDPLGGAEIVVGAMGEKASLRGQELVFAVSGDALALGGADATAFLPQSYQVFPDGSLLVIGMVDGKRAMTLVTRAPDGSAALAWCRPLASTKSGAPDGARRGDALIVFDRDITEDLAFTAEVGADGSVKTRATTAIAGPWVHDDLIWWQPDAHTLCAGPELGEPTEQHTLAEAHVGPGRLLRLAGRKLFLPAHGVSILDLAPAKKGKEEISRKHKASDEPLYREAEKILLPIREAMARRGIRVTWRGVERSGKSIYVLAQIVGEASLMTHVLFFALQQGVARVLTGFGLTGAKVMGGSFAFREGVQPAATTARDLRSLVSALDAAGINRACGFHLQSLLETANQRGLALPWTTEAEDFALAATLSGLRGETVPVRPATTADFAEVAPILADYDATQKLGIVNTWTAGFLAISGTHRFGADAVAPLIDTLKKANPSFPDNVSKALGQPFTPYVAPVVPEVPLSDDETPAFGALNAVLEGELKLDAKATHEGRAWARFALDGVPMQAGLNGDARVIATLCATDTDVNLRKLNASLARANKAGGRARFIEADGYIQARARCPMAEADAAQWKACIEACRDAVRSEAGRALALEYTTME